MNTGNMIRPVMRDIRRNPLFVAYFGAAVSFGIAAVLWYAGTPEDVAPAALFLASPAARFITGQTLPVDGGFSAA